MMVLAIFLLVVYLVFFVYILNNIAKGNLQYTLFYLIIFLPVYTVFLSFVYNYTESTILIKALQFTKEVVIFSTVAIFLFANTNPLLSKQWALSRLDKVFIVFLGIGFIYLLLPIGESTFLSKVIYYKNMLLGGACYFLGRNITLPHKKWKLVFRTVFTVTLLAFLLVSAEYLIGRHFHSIIGYAKYYSGIYEIDPVGTYGLSWTFEAQGGQPRYGAFFATPLELSSSMLFSFALSIILLLSVRYKANKFKYLALLAITFACVLMAYSRASIASFLFLLVFMAFVLNYYRLIALFASVCLVIVSYVVFFASEEVRYFVIDTISFQDSSSLAHVVEWVEAVDSMVQNPEGIGLAMSGNAGSVDDDIKIGGESQFLIYGVQLGVIGLILYVYLIYLSISRSWKAYNLSQSREEKIIPFVSASVKFGLLLPLLTANAEIYLYISLVSWWLVGAAETIYGSHLKVHKKKLLYRPGLKVQTSTGFDTQP